MIVRSVQHRGSRADETRFEATLVSDAPQGMDHKLRFVLNPDASPEMGVEVRLPHPVFLRLGLKIGERRTLAVHPRAIHIFEEADHRGDEGTAD